MWSGMGVIFKTIDTTPRVIFWARYMDWVVTGPLMIACLAMLSKADLVTLVFMMVTFAARAMPPIDHFDGRTLAAFGMYGVVDLF